MSSDSEDVCGTVPSDSEDVKMCDTVTSDSKDVRMCVAQCLLIVKM